MSSTFQHSDDGVLGRTPYMYALYLQEFTKHANAQSERIYASYGPDLLVSGNRKHPFQFTSEVQGLSNSIPLHPMVKHLEALLQFTCR